MADRVSENGIERIEALPAALAGEVAAISRQLRDLLALNDDMAVLTAIVQRPHHMMTRYFSDVLTADPRRAPPVGSTVELGACARRCAGSRALMINCARWWPRSRAPTGSSHKPRPWPESRPRCLATAPRSAGSDRSACDSRCHQAYRGRRYPARAQIELGSHTRHDTRLDDRATGPDQMVAQQSR
jgi:hypothetical protein